MQQHPSPAADPRILAISDGRPGNARQAEALAEAVWPGQIQVLHLDPRAPWRWLSPRRWPGSTRAFGPEFARVLAAPPHGVIGCGRQAALATRLLRAAGSRAVQILDPRIAHRHWDWLLIPEHDRVEGENIVKLRGSLHPVDDAWLTAARLEFAALEQFPRPRLSVLVGGDSRHGRMPGSVQAELLAMLRDWHATTGGSVFMTTSRRTPPALTAELVRHMHTIPGMCWTGDGRNPYPGFLAFADVIACTSDSVNLISEACATRVPVCALGIDTAGGGPGRFVRSLLESGRIHASLPMDATAAITPLRETARIAAIVRGLVG